MAASDTAVKALCFILRWSRVVWAWGLRFVKIRVFKHRLCKAQRNLDRRMARLGAEFYTLHRQGEKEFLKSLVVRQQFKIVEEAELRLLAIHDRIDAVEKEYRGKKEKISEGAAKSG